MFATWKSVAFYLSAFALLLGLAAYAIHAGKENLASMLVGIVGGMVTPMALPAATPRAMVAAAAVVGGVMAGGATLAVLS